MSDYSSLAPSSPFEGSTFKIPNSQFMFGAFCRFEAEDVVQPTDEEDDARGNFGEVGPLGQGGGFPSLSRVDPSWDDGAARSCCHPNYHTHTSRSTYCSLHPLRSAIQASQMVAPTLSLLGSVTGVFQQTVV